MQTLSAAIREANRTYPKLLNPEFVKSDIYTRKVNRISLLDIEQEPLPLSLDSIKRISRFLRGSSWAMLERFTPWKSKNTDTEVAQEMAIMLPTLAVARAREIKIPSQLKPLNDRLTAYLDYYSSFIASPHLDEEQEYLFLNSVGFVGRRFLDGLGSFLPVRLGLTPSSAIKLFLEKSATGSHNFYWEILGRKIRPFMTEAYSDKSLPKEIGRYQHYSQETDMKAANLLKPYLSGTFPTDSQSLYDRFHRYQNALRSEILKSPEHFLRLPVQHAVIKEILLATQYKQTLIFVLRLGEANNHLTVEINGRDRIYGIPAELLRENPHVDDLIVSDILRPVLYYAHQLFPNIEPKIQIRPVRSIFPEKTPVIPVITEDIARLPKPKRRVITPLFFNEPELPQQPCVSESKYNVLCTRSQIETMSGNILSEKMINRIMSSIEQFEWTGKGAKKLVDVQNCFRIREGRYRICLEQINPGVFRVIKVDHRKEVYRGL